MHAAGSVASVMTSWSAARQAPLSMGFSRQEYWSGLPCPPPGDLPNAGIEPTSPASPALQADSFPLNPPGKPDKMQLKKKTSYVIPSSSIAEEETKI